MLRSDGWQASPSGRGPSGAVREAEEAQAGSGARIIETAARRLKRDGIHGPGIAALMAEAGLARRHRTAGRAAVRTGIIDYARTIIAGEHRRAEEHVARYGKEHKQATRQRIIEMAGRRLKRDGIDGSGVATLMADAGLTNGAFYAHFASKDDLVAAAVAGQLREQRESLSAVTPGRAGVEQYVRAYLSVQHRDNPGDGCPSAALLDEIGRCTDATRQAYTDGLLAVIDDVAARLAPHDPPSARVKTLSVFALMAGTLQLSRALADRQLADEILEQGIQNALALLDAGQQR